MIQMGARIVILAPDQELTPGQRVYCPQRRTNVSMPGWTTV